MRSSLKVFLALHALLAMTITGSLACKGVMFRLDNVQDFYMSRQQKAIVDIFVQKKTPLTLGVIGNFFGIDSDLVNYLKNASTNGGVSIETACNGWNYEDWSVLTGAQQTDLLTKCSNQLTTIFGTSPKTFVPPMGAYNEETKTSLASKGYTHLSSDSDFDNAVHNSTSPLVCNAAAWTSDSTNAVYFHGVGADITWTEIQQSMTKYGYAVVSIHPFEFAPWVNGVYDELSVVSSQLAELATLIDKVKAATYEANIISSSNEVPVPRTDLNCYFGTVAFRLDDIQDFYMNIQQKAIMERFASEKVPLTVGVISGFIGEDVELVADVQQRSKNTSMFEVACHGWNHEDFTNYTLAQQTELFNNCTRVINSFFQIPHPRTFIAPYNAFNADTYAAMRATGYDHISTDVDLDPPPYNTTNPYRFPEGAWTSDYDTAGYYAPVSADYTMNQIKDQVTKYGFSVVMLHPYEYSKCNETACDSSYLNNTQLNELSRLFTMVRQASYRMVLIGDMQDYIPLNGQNCNGSSNTTGSTGSTTSTAGSTTSGSGVTGYTSGFTGGWTSGFTTGTSGGIGNLWRGLILFRLDGVRDYFFSAASASIMNMFKEYNIPLTIGLSGGAVGTDPVLTQAIRSVMESGLDVELACNGVLAEDYSTLSSSRQAQYLALCSQRINSIFGVTPSSFIPPLGRFNKNTIPALLSTGYDVLSSYTQFDLPPYIDQSSPTSVYRWPANAFTGMMTPDGFNPFAATETLDQIGYQLTSFGFAVVSINPMGFASAYDSSSVDPAALAELATILQAVISYTDVSSTTLDDLSTYIHL